MITELPMRTATVIVGRRKKKKKVIWSTSMQFRILVARILMDGTLYNEQSPKAAQFIGTARDLDDLSQAGWKLISTNSIFDAGMNKIYSYAYLEKEFVKP
jgi:hypothetical protein